MLDAVTWAASCAALFAVAVARLVMPPRRALGNRVAPYVALGRSRLGAGATSTAARQLVFDQPGSAVLGVFGPALVVAADRLSRLVDAADNDELERRLRQSGIEHPEPAQYRMRQLVSAVVGCVAGASVGAAVFGVGTGSLVLFVCFAVAGLSMQRGALDRAISRRRALMRFEVPVIAQLLAVHLRTGHGPVESLRQVVLRCGGPVAADCRSALGLIAGGMSPQLAYQRLAEISPEPAATRLYRLLASSVVGGGDVVVPLLAVANEVRTEQREAMARRAVKRRTAMLVPLLLFVAPVMVLFVAAALPSLVFGPR